MSTFKTPYYELSESVSQGERGKESHEAGRMDEKPNTSIGSIEEALRIKQEAEGIRRQMNLKESILQILSQKKAKLDGLHVKHIARHIHNANNTLFSELNEIDFDKLKRKVNRVLASDVKRKRNNLFMKVINPKTKKFRKGYYKLKPSHFIALKPATIVHLKNRMIKQQLDKTSRT